jgi:hypothetical protein
VPKTITAALLALALGACASHPPVAAACEGELVPINQTATDARK